MGKRKYSVPFITETTDIYEVEAQSPAHAAFDAGEQRRAGTPPTHSHATTRLGTTKLTLEPTPIDEMNARLDAIGEDNVTEIRPGKTPA
jgi:hypothetical protein